MRAFDNWNSYLDNDGNLLHGKIRFCKKGTTDDIVIRNSDGTPIRNPEFTDMLGRTEYQVFVDSSANVTAYFYKYIGTGDMMTVPEDYDPSRWAYQYSSDDIDPVNSIDLVSDTAQGVSTVDSLRDLDPATVPEVDGAKLMWVYGYYAPGDTSPVLYAWDPSCTHADDGGAYIQPTGVPGNGRWVLATRELHFDVRHYGIFPTDDIYSTDTQYTSQLANCAAYLNAEGLDAWFPALNNELSYYLLNGSNTFSVLGDIYVSDAVRMQCVSGTTGTAISCRTLHKSTPGLFVSTVQNGTGTLTADWVNISWLGGQMTGDARVGWVIDDASYPRTVEGKAVKFVANGHPSLVLKDCEIESNGFITGEITIQGSVLKTSFFADNYDWTKLSSYGNTILVDNCSDAETYVLLKNKQAEPDYGDLGERTLSGATLLPGAIAENATFSAVTVQGATELHNVTGSVLVSGSSLDLNAVDCWLTLSGTCVASGISVRRGELTRVDAVSTLQATSSAYLEGVSLGIPLDVRGASAELRGCRVGAVVTATAISVTGCDVWADIDQKDDTGVIHVNMSGNTFHGTAQHYVHADTADSVVSGVWTGNGSTYSDRHWIRLDRTNLAYQDNAHSYTYAGNSEPYLSRWSGRNRPMRFKTWGGHRSSSARGDGVFATTQFPFLFFNDRTREVTCVPRGNYWKMFTVGRGYLARSGHIQSMPLTIGISEGDYVDHTNGKVPLVWTWGCDNYTISGTLYGVPGCVSRDGDGLASYDVSFEAASADHSGAYSYGPNVGWYPSGAWDSGSWENLFPVYPDEGGQATLFVFVDPDFTTGTNPVG